MSLAVGPAGAVRQEAPRLFLAMPLLSLLMMIGLFPLLGYLPSAPFDECVGTSKNNLLNKTGLQARMRFSFVMTLSLTMAPRNTR